MSPGLRNRHQEDGSLADVVISYRRNYRDRLADASMQDARYVGAAATIDNQQIAIRNISRLNVRYAALNKGVESGAAEYAS